MDVDVVIVIEAGAAITQEGGRRKQRMGPFGERDSARGLPMTPLLTPLPHAQCAVCIVLRRFHHSGDVDNGSRLHQHYDLHSFCIVCCHRLTAHSSLLVTFLLYPSEPLFLRCPRSVVLCGLARPGPILPSLNPFLLSTHTLNHPNSRSCRSVPPPL